MGYADGVIMSHIKKIKVISFCFVFFVGCASGSVNERESGAMLGGGLGAGLGAIVGAATGNAGVGTAIGAGAGALTGAVAGEAARREKEQIKKEIREEMTVNRFDADAYLYDGTPRTGYSKDDSHR